MARQLPPTAGADPMLSVARHHLRRHAVSTPGELRRAVDRLERNDPLAPRVRPVVSGSRSDGTALLSLLEVGARLGLWDDQTTS